VSQLDVQELTEQYAIIQDGRKPKRWPGDEGERYYYFSLHAPNHEIVAQSEQYTTKQSAKDTLDKYFYNFRVVDSTDEK